MMDRNYKLIPADKQYKGAPLLDTTLNIDLDGTNRHLIEGDISVPLNLAERFNDERQNFSLYRIYGKLQPYIENVYSGRADQTVSNLIYNMYLTSSYLSANTTTTSVNFFGYPDFSEFDFVRNDVDESVNDETNWNLYVTIPTTCDELQPMSFTAEEGGNSMSFMAYEGIPYVIKTKRVDGRNLLEFTCPVPHGLNKSDYVILDIKEPTNYTFSNGISTYPIFSFGNGKRKSEKYVFNLYIPQVDVGNNTINDGALGVFKRQINKSDSFSISNYYVLVHEIITNVEDYQITSCGFAEGVFKRIEKFQPSSESPNNQDRIAVKQDYPTYIYTFTKDINVKKYLDNLKRPITTLYVSILLRNNLGYFNYPPNYGWEWNFPYSFSDSNTLSQVVKGNPNDLQPVTGLIYNIPGNDTTSPFKSGIPLVPGDKLRGAFTEYNNYELKERTISEIKHSFNFNSQIFSGSDGYMYKPHYPVKIRVYSDYIENGDPKKVANIPNYSTYFEIEKTWKWRDIYEIGFVEGTNGVDYPFLNAAHYPKRDINFFTSRTVRSTAFSSSDSISFSGANNTLENFVIDGCE